MTDKEKLAAFDAMQAENARLKAIKIRPLTCKVGAKGGVSVYGLGRFPVSLYGGQWERLIEFVPQIKTFLAANASKLATKEVTPA